MYLRIVSTPEGTDHMIISYGVKRMDERGYTVAGYTYKGRSWLSPDGLKIVQYMPVNEKQQSFRG